MANMKILEALPLYVESSATKQIQTEKIYILLQKKEKELSLLLSSASY